MRKIGAFVLGSLVAFNTVAASAATITESFELRNVTVTVTDTLKEEKPTMQLLDKNKTKMFYADEGSLTSDDKYVFEFKMATDMASGDYVIRIGENGTITEKTVYYPSYAEIVEMLTFCESEGFTAEALLSKYKKVLGAETEAFDLLTSAYKDRVTAEIKKLTISAADDEAVKTSRKAVLDTLNKWVNYGTLLLTKDKATLDEAIKVVGTLDTKYYASVSEVSMISDAVSASNPDILTMSESDVAKLFDGAVLVCTILQNDWATGKEALVYFDEKGLFGDEIEAKHLDAAAAVYKDLKDEEILDYKLIPETLAEIYDDYAGSKSSGGGGGGGVSISGGSTKVNASADSGASQNSTTKSENPASAGFRDMGSATWATEAVDALVKLGAINGKSEGVFAPQDSITRAEFVKIIVSAFSLTQGEKSVAFSDVSDGDWYAKAVQIASSLGLVSGISENEFGAGLSITREDMAVIAARLSELKGIENDGSGVRFNDAAQISEYAQEAVSKLSSSGIISGMGDNMFMPKEKVTRAQAAKIIYELLNKTTGGAK